ncbi:MAG: formylglycine-generating enzyme family protein, partial [Thermoplasmata archaeon]
PYCFNCGSWVQEFANFCSTCGSALKSGQKKAEVSGRDMPKAQPLLTHCPNGHKLSPENPSFECFECMARFCLFCETEFRTSIPEGGYLHLCKDCYSLSLKRATEKREKGVDECRTIMGKENTDGRVDTGRIDNEEETANEGDTDKKKSMPATDVSMPHSSDKKVKLKKVVSGKRKEENSSKKLSLHGGETVIKEEYKTDTPVYRLSSSKKEKEKTGDGKLITIPLLGNITEAEKEDILKDLPIPAVNSIGMRFMLLPAGEFMMGSKANTNSVPVHKVRISKPFFLGVVPVTQIEWLQVMGTNPFRFHGDTLPAASISFYEAKRFIAALNYLENTNKYRLPTEAEWEYACRAGCAGEYDSNDYVKSTMRYAWFGEHYVKGSTYSVGKGVPNKWGLYDMHGNVWEWCNDYYEEDYYSVSPEDDPKGPEESPWKVIRGGSWSFPDGYCPAAHRRCANPYSRFDYLGFRVARDF